MFIDTIYVNVWLLYQIKLSNLLAYLNKNCVLLQTDEISYKCKLPPIS